MFEIYNKKNFPSGPTGHARTKGAEIDIMEANTRK